MSGEHVGARGDIGRYALSRQERLALAPPNARCQTAFRIDRRAFLSTIRRFAKPGCIGEMDRRSQGDRVKIRLSRRRSDESHRIMEAKSISGKSEGRFSKFIRKLYDEGSFRQHRAAVLARWIAQQHKLGWTLTRRPKSFSVSPDHGLPPLAWLCEVKSDHYRFRVGSKVEVAGDRIFEGVWDDRLASSDFSTSELFFGSGALRKRHVVFVPPRHGFEYLFIIFNKKDDITYISNSICFALRAASIEESDDFFRLVEKHLNTSTDAATMSGIDHYEPLVCENECFRLHRMMFYNFSLGQGGRIRTHAHLPRQRFASFGEYRLFLSKSLKLIFANAADESRRHPLRPVTAISKGYDSPAVSVLAKENGCSLALTLDVTMRGRSDSGAEIADQLGLDVVSKRHVMGDAVRRLNLDFENDLKDKALEFIATAGVGDDVTFLPFESHLDDAMLLTGALGDSVWERQTTLPPGLPVRVVFGKSITEFRLRVGFAHIPVPAIGARYPKDIAVISNSTEMQPFSLGTQYDRPIARRIVEEAGIERSEFGIAKCATAPLALNHASLFLEAFSHVMKRYG